MPSYRDIVYGIYGAFRLARLEAGAMSYFERTTAGFWKSFFAAVIVAPGFAIIIGYQLSQAEAGIEAGVLRIFLVQALAYVLGWVRSRSRPRGQRWRSGLMRLMPGLGQTSLETA